MPSVDATPGTFTDILEEPFGLNDTHLFVIRTTSDNLGLYESMRSESFLVAIDLASGDEEIWVLDRVRRFIDYSEDGETLGPVVQRDDGLIPVNPYTVLARRDALPWAAIARHSGTRIAPVITQDNDRITANYNNDPVYMLSTAMLTRRLTDLTASTAANVVDVQRISSMTTRQVFEGRRIPVESCRPEHVLDYWALGQQPDYILMRVHCGDVEDFGITSIIVRLDQVSQQTP